MSPDEELIKLLRDIYLVNDGKLIRAEKVATTKILEIVIPNDVLSTEGLIAPFNLRPVGVGIAPADHTRGYIHAASSVVTPFLQGLRVEAGTTSTPSHYKLFGNVDDVDYITNLQGKSHPSTYLTAS